MTDIIITQYTGAILGPIAKLLGIIMNWIFEVTCLIFPAGSNLYGNIGLCIIVFTIIIYIFLLPLTIKQQKFSKLSQKMQPEIKAIQNKYKNKKDQASMMAMNEETNMVYQKYGISPSGSCVQLLVQMPILFALYRVIYNVPAYVSGLKEYFTPVVDGIISIKGHEEVMKSFMEEIGLKTVQLNFEGTAEQARDSIIDVLYKIPTTAWDTLRESFPSISGSIDTLEMQLGSMNDFLGINIANSPVEVIKSGWGAGQYLLVIGALLVPILSALTQIINIKLMPSSVDSDNPASDTMASSMKTMNTMMPLMSFIMVFTFPVGMGIYWIAGSVIRSIQQIAINRYMSKMDLDALIQKNQEKAKKKREKKGVTESQIANTARINTKKFSDRATVSSVDKEEKIQRAYEVKKNAKEGSLAQKANMVKEFNERNNK